MRRDDFRLEVSNVAWLEGGDEPRQPTLSIRASVPADDLRERLEDRSDGSLSAADVDVTFRFQAGADEGTASGVLAFANRMTGEFLLEVNALGEDVMEFVGAARRYAERTDGAARYRATVRAGGDPVVDFEKRTLLVYSGEGELLRQRSLIPSGVEI